MAAEMTASTAAEFRSSSLGRASVRALIASWLGWMFDGYETYALVLVMGSAVHQFLSPERMPKASVYIGGLLAATMLGWAGGGIAAGILADYFGRRRTLMLSILCYAVFSGLAAISWDYWSLLAFRFLVGLGLGAEWGPGAAIVAEQWAPASRGKAGGVLHAAYGVGLLLASGIWLFVSRLGQSSWRYMFLVGILPALLLLYVRRWVDEPAVWTETSRNRREARQRIQMGKGSSHDKHLVRFTVSEILSDLELRRRIGILLLMSVTTVVGWWSASTWIPEFAAQLNARSQSQMQLSSSIIGLMFSLGSVAGFLTLGFFADTVGRKPTIWFYYLGALVVTLCYFLLARERTALLVMAGVNGFFSSGQFAWMTIYLPELFPTRVRGTAMSLVFDTSRSIAGLGPLLAGWLVTLFGGIGNAAAVMSLIYIVGLIATPFAGAETRGKPLPA
jgi:MFS family permease